MEEVEERVALGVDHVIAEMEMNFHTGPDLVNFFELLQWGYKNQLKDVTKRRVGGTVAQASANNSTGDRYSSLD